MMNLFKSRAALIAASLAALSLTATPVSARHWRHHRGIDGGDVLAGVLIIGGLAAIASAASKSNRDARRDRDYRYPDRDYPRNGDYRNDRDYRDDDTRYGTPSRNDRYESGAIDGAVNACVDEVERGNRNVDVVDSVNRDAEGWRVIGKLRDGREFDCTADSDGRVRSATVDGRALT